MSPVKEPCYFASEVRKENLSHRHFWHLRQTAKLHANLSGKPVRPNGWLFSEWDDYVRLFQNANGETAIGEASPIYLWSTTAAQRIAERLPDAKIIMILRDPAERAFSQYLHQLAMGLTSSTFRTHVDRCLRNQDRNFTAYYPFLELGLYHQQVQRFFDHFPRRNIRIYWFEEAWRQPQFLFLDLFKFLNVDANFKPDTSRKSMQRRAPRFAALNHAIKTIEITYHARDFLPAWLLQRIQKLLSRDSRSLVLNPRDRRYVIDFYREDIDKLASLLKRDLSGWLN